jgi:hypothetical protein
MEIENTNIKVRDCMEKVGVNNHRNTLCQSKTVTVVDVDISPPVFAFSDHTSLSPFQTHVD